MYRQSFSLVSGKLGAAESRRPANRLAHLRRPSFHLVAFLALGFFGHTAQALQAFTLKDALQTGMVNSPTVQSAEAKREEGKWKGLEGLSMFLPTIDVSGAHYFEKKYQLLDVPFGGANVEIPQIFPSSSASADAKWLLFDGLGNVEVYKAAQRAKESADSNYNWTVFAAGHDIALAYAKVVSTKKLEDVSEENLKTLQNHLDQTKQLKAGGLATNYDVLRVESQLSEAQVDLLQAKDNIQIAQENLGKTLGISEPADATDTELSIPSPEKIKDLAYGHDTNKRQDLLSLQQTVQATDFAEAGASRFWVPKIYLGADYTKYNNLSDPLSDWKNYRSSWSIGLMFDWQIFAPRTFAQAKQEFYKSLQTEKSLIQANLQAPVDFAFWKKRYLYSSAFYDAKKVDLDRATETVRLAQAGFKAGVRTTTEVLDAELELFRARAGIVNAQMNCIEAKEKLELALGENL